VLQVDEPGKAPDPRAVALALRDALRIVATDPIVLAIDDVQWLDASSATALAFALRRLAEAPIGLLMTMRLEEGKAAAVAHAVPASFAVKDLHMAPLDHDALDELLRREPGVSVSTVTRREIARVSAGNPFFALELARAAAHRGRGTPEAARLEVPPSLRELLGERIACVPSDVRRALLLVAAASQPTVSLVETVLGAERAADLLAAAVTASILEVDRGRLRFAHPLLASVVYGDAESEERMEAHAALADVTSAVEERAFHFAVATTLPNATVARLLDDAAAHALARGAPAAAADFAEHALRLTLADDIAAVARRTTVAADAYWSAGETARARALMEELVPLVAGGNARARALRLLGRAIAYEEGYVAALDVLERAIGEAGIELRLRAALERDVALGIMNAGDVRLAAAHAEAAVAAAEQLGDADLLADARATYDSVRFFLGEGVPRDVAARARELAFGDEEPDAGFLARAQVLACLLKWSDDFSGARTVLDALRRHLVEREEDGPLLPVLFHLGELECWAGNLAAADTFARAVDASVAQLGPGLSSQSLYLSALIAAIRGDVAEAEAAARRGLELAEGRDIRLIVRNLKVLGFLGLSVGDAAGAERWLGRAAQLAAEHGWIDPGFSRHTADAIEARVGIGDLDGAEREAVALEMLGRRLDRPWALATGARSRGLVAAAQGDLVGAASALEQALAAHERLPEPFERGRTLLALGSVQRRLRHKRWARETLADAAAVFESIPAPLWVERARSEAARIGGRVPVGGELTEVERRIAELVAAGYSNAEVAQTLVVSRKTVEWNLSNVYRKLGVRSRTELARRGSAVGDG
jgi:DNA-binding CsgD family transcriptional regulator